MARGRLETLELTRDTVIKEIIRSLWREYYGLYNERYKSVADLDENGDPIESWLRNIISEDIDFGQAIGMDHQVNGEQSIGIGIGAITWAFREIIMGSYGLDTEAISADEWDPQDLLFVLGNGTGPETRSNAIEVFKSGFINLLNGLKIGKYDHRTAAGEQVVPADWTLSKEPAGLSFWKNGQWNLLGASHPPVTIHPDSKDLAEIGDNQVLSIKKQGIVDVIAEEGKTTVTEIIKTISGNNHESYLIENTLNVSETVESSWTVIPYNEQVGEFKAVVMVRNKVTNTIITLISLLSFDYTAGEVECILQSNLLTNEDLTLTVGINEAHILYGTISGMPEVGKRIHLCYERCILSERPILIFADGYFVLDGQAVLTGDANAEADGTLVLTQVIVLNGDGLIEAGGTLVLQGNSVGGMTADGLLNAEGNIAINATSILVASANIMANSNIALNGLAVISIAGIGLLDSAGNISINGTAVISYTTGAIVTLTVEFGTGDGIYVENTEHEILPTIPAGFYFAAWTGDTDHITTGLVTDENVTITMPAFDITLTATFLPLRLLTVNYGTITA